MTIETEVAALTTAVNALTATVNVKKSELDASVSTAAISATAAAGSFTAATAQAQTAQGQASLAQGYAASASSVVQQDLSGITAQALHRSPNAITAQFIYDTSKDSDGGAWTERCQSTSWYNEALAGKWLGPHSSETNARFEGATLGSELVANPNFTNNITGWAGSSSYAGSTASWDNGALKLVVGPSVNYSDGNLSTPITVSAGKIYRVTVNVRSSTGQWFIYIGNQSSAIAYHNTGPSPIKGVYTYYVYSTNTQLTIHPYAYLANSVVLFDEISVKEVTALNTASNDYFQLTTDGKFYRLYKNLLLNTGTLTAAGGWVVSNATSVVGATDPNAGTSAYTFTATANNGYIFRQSNKAISGVQHTNSIYVRRVSGSGAVTLYNDLGSEVAITLTTSWARYSTTWTATGINGYCGIKLAVSGDVVEIWNPQEEIGNVATAYEAKAAEGTTSEIFRGNKADFPRLAAIVAEMPNFVIYDLTEPGRPMWMSFTGGFESFNAGGRDCIAALNGIIAAGGNTSVGGASYDLHELNFVKDNVLRRADTFGGWYKGNISQRNAGLNWDLDLPATGRIVNRLVNAVAMAVLPDAPIDPASGLRVPTIAVATLGGVSVIKQNGSVVNIVNGDANLTTYVGFTRDNRIITQLYDDNRGLRVFDIPNANVTQPNHYTRGFAVEWYTDSKGSPYGDVTMIGADTSNPAVTQLVSHMGNKFVRAVQNASDTINIVSRNRSTPTKSLLSTLSSKYNTGWLTGDIRRAYLSDVTAESISGSELLPQVASEWLADAATVSDASGAIRVTNTGSNGEAYKGFATTIGKIYSYSVQRLGGTSVGAYYFSNNAPNAWTGSLPYEGNAASGSAKGVFVASATTTYIRMEIGTATVGQYHDYIVSVREAIADRSYKAQGAAITGTLTKAQLASGTSLVGYSGFSASNYLREPYSADLDFGTGEWNASAWVNVPSSALTANYPVYGSDLLAGAGAFTSSTGWTGLSADCTVSGGSLTKVGGSTHYVNYPLPTLTQGDVVLLKFDVVSLGGSIGVRIGHAPGWNYLPVSSTGTQYRIFTAFNVANGNVVGFDFLGSQTGTIQNLTAFKVKPSAILSRSFSSGAYIELAALGGNYLRATAYDGTTTRAVTFPPFTGADSNPVISKDTWLKAEANYTTDGSLTIRVNGREVAATRGNPLLTLNNTSAVLTIGNNYAADAPFPGTIALLKLGATVPTPEQATFMYEQERQLFRANAQSVLPDAGNVVDMAYDDATDRWVAVSAANESYWTGLVRNTVTPVPAGSYTKIVATSGIELAARSTTNPGVDVTIPAYGLREELVKRSEAAARLGKELVTFDYVGGFTANTTNGNTAITSASTITYPASYIGARISGSGIPANATIVAVSGTTLYLSAAATATATGVSITFLDFALPVGMEAKTVLSAGTVKQEGSTKDFTRLYDGFIETIRFGTAPGVTTWVQIQAQRVS